MCVCETHSSRQGPSPLRLRASSFFQPFSVFAYCRQSKWRGKASERSQCAVSSATQEHGHLFRKWKPFAIRERLQTKHARPSCWSSMITVIEFLMLFADPHTLTIHPSHLHTHLCNLYPLSPLHPYITHTLTLILTPSHPHTLTLSLSGQAYLAQSPQLYKQMALCADFEKIFTIGSGASEIHSFFHFSSHPPSSYLTSTSSLSYLPPPPSTLDPPPPSSHILLVPSFNSFCFLAPSSYSSCFQMSFYH